MKPSRLLLSALALFVLFTLPAAAQSLSTEKQQVLDEAQALAPTVEELSMALWDYSETALHETQSAERLASELERNGFTVERGVADMPTAFVASYGSGRPIIGILAEFDALPGVGNKAAPEQAPRDDGNTAGHGCGHNVFGAASTAGAIALKRVMEAQDLPGTIRMYGTPAEETVVGKVYMAKAGLFADLDAAIEWHPSTETGTINNPGLAMNNFTVEFRGQSAHGAADPWNGRSALDAVELMNYGVNLMREHVRPTSRIHYVVQDGGNAPNVVPDYAKVWYYVRDINRNRVEANYQRILNIAEGAALGTGTTHDVHLTTGVHERLLIRPLQEAVQSNMDIVGPPNFTEDDQQFARAMQRFIDADQDGFSAELKPLADSPEAPSGGSTDVAEVSYSAPTVGFRVATAPQNVPWHSWCVSASHGTDAALRGGNVATQVIALTGYDMMTDADLLDDAQATFDDLTNGAPYESPIPADQAPPVPPTSSR